MRIMKDILYSEDIILICGLSMANYWQPKYKVVCTNCKWKGVRRYITKPCPKCGELRSVEKVPVETLFTELDSELNKST
jgi:hypothetical protein